MRGLKIIDRSSNLLSLSFLREKGVGEELNLISIFMMDLESSWMKEALQKASVLVA